VEEAEARVTIYVLMKEPYHDISTVLGVFSSLELAEAHGNRLIKGDGAWLHDEESIHAYRVNATNVKVVTP
jgi:hypothetical protein